jgi:trigger factor
LEYNISKDNDIEKEIEISVPRSELEKLIDEETEKLRKEVKLDGYRKGRVPQTLIRSKYEDSLKIQAMDRLVKRSYLTLLDEKHWQPASQAELLKIEEGDPIKFRLHIEVIPEFQVDNYLNIEIFKEQPVPDEFLLEQGMNALKEQHAEVKEVDRPAVVDDVVTLDIEVKEKEKSNKETDRQIKIGDRALPDELNRALVGIRSTEKKEVKAGNVLYKLSIKKIEEKKLPTIDDEFAKKLNFSDVDEMKKKLLENIKIQEDKRAEENLKENLSEVLLERIQFKVPNTPIQKEYEKILKDYNLPNSESNKERFWNVAEKRIRFNLILDKIRTKENLQVAESEIMNFVDKMGIKLNEENRNDVIEYLGGIMNREKTIDFLYKKAKISEKSRIVTPKEVANDTRSVRH